MAGDYDQISIKDAIAAIDGRDLLLPAIQRNFVWSSHQVCVLFDSLMRGYPINSFMMWDVKTPEIKKNYRFYTFLENYCKRFDEENKHLVTDGHKDFKAVIDGQQRLTSIYIGLKGTYAYKKPRVWWPDAHDEKILPRRKLYIDLMSSLQDDDNESMMQHNFRFLADDQYKQSLGKDDVHWFEVREILSQPDVMTVDKIPFQVALPYLRQHGLEFNEYALETLTRLYMMIRKEKVIHFYTETNQAIDHVLDVFIRTNSGGTTLAFSDLLMSIAIANWKGDARQDIDSLVKLVRQSSEMGFSIGRDWVLKTCLMLTDADIRFRVKNFDGDQVKIIEENWQKIRDCIVAGFKLIRSYGLNDQALLAKNAVIPIIYYLYKQKVSDKPLYQSINNPVYHRDERIEIGRWLHMVLLKTVFGSQGDGLLSKMRKLIDNNLATGIFPLDQIIDGFKGTNKDLRFDEERLQSLLNTQYGDSRCRPILSLMFPDVNENQMLHIDHLHPKSSFAKDGLKDQVFLADEPELMEFYADPRHWNSLPNLHLLNSSLNCSKNADPLSSWIQDPNNGFRKEDLLIGTEVSLDFEQFKPFYVARHSVLMKRLRSKLYMSDTPLALEEVVVAEDDDEEDAA